MTTQDTINLCRGFIGKGQMAAMLAGLRGEERDFFRDKFLEMGTRIELMHKTGEQDGRGGAAVVWLHYFAGGRANWYITEKDMGSPDDAPGTGQTQAFGLADLFGDGGEIGYISIVEILENGGELDLYFKPKTLGEVRGVAEPVTA